MASYTTPPFFLRSSKKYGMTIKDVSEKYNVSQATLRYYEKTGIIPPVTRKNGIRDYQEKDEHAVELVLCMRKAGLPIESISRYVALKQEGDVTIKERLSILQGEREALIAKKRRSKVL